MIVFKTIQDLQAFLAKSRLKNQKIAFVPTMGALHAGHISLITAARKNDTLVVSSIFVNPTQFNDPSDFEKYPKTIEIDILTLEENGCDVLFLPTVKEMYPTGTKNTRKYLLGNLETILEGKFREGHFQGVCQVVHRLLEIVEPDQLLLGQKDYQQVMIIKKLINLLGMTISVTIGETVRETSGLAMSSRNIRLNESNRLKASAIYASLLKIKKDILSGPVQLYKEKAMNDLIALGFKIDYIEIANVDTLEIISHWDGKTKLVVVAAVFLQEVRLIDNILI
jgi:pantoate--beta-alanine ligase